VLENLLKERLDKKLKQLENYNTEQLKELNEMTLMKESLLFKS